MFQALFAVLGLGTLVTLLIAFESLQDVYMQVGMSTEWRNKMKSKFKEISGADVSDEHLSLFVESFADNSFQKLDVLKTLLWANIGLVVINGLEDKLQENAGAIKDSIVGLLKKIPMPVKFSIKGAKNKVVRDLVEQKQEKVKKLSDYMHQATLTGANMLNATNTGSLPKIYKQDNLKKLSPQEQATYKAVMAMLNTVQASR